MMTWTFEKKYDNFRKKYLCKYNTIIEVYTIFSLQYNISLRQLQTNTEQTSEESSSLPEKSSSSTREEQPVLNQINKIKNLTLFKACDDKINQKMVKDM